MRRAARVDANQAELVAALRKLGCSVEPLHAVGKGVPDLLVGYRGDKYLIEVKDGEKPPSKRKLRPTQEDWHANWRGSVHVFKSIDDVLDWVYSMSP